MKNKKWISLIAAGVLLAGAVFGLAGCGKNADADEATGAFLNGTTINGEDVSLLNAEEAAEYLASCAENYSLTLCLGEDTYALTGDDIGMVYDDTADIQGLLDQQTVDPTVLSFEVEGLYTFDLAPLSSMLEEKNAEYAVEAQAQMDAAMAELTGDSAEEADALLEETDEQANETIEIADPYEAQDAYIAIDEAQAAFVIVPDQSSVYIDTEAVAAAVEEAINNGVSFVVLEDGEYNTPATVKADDPELLAALDEANSYLDIDLTYTFTPEGSNTSTLSIGRNTLLTLFRIGTDGRTVEVDEEALGTYTSELAETYAGETRNSPFVTTNGTSINISVSSAGQSVDANALYEDMKECLLNKTSGTREAPYATESEDSEGYWGGNYVEVDLTNQHLWCYNNGECVLSCSVVSGCVANGTTTPTGCFTIFSKETDRYLKGTNVDGSTYNSHVSYFMPFSGGCGIHDATWRSSFGGSIYLYSGSHGCVGVTLANAKVIYNNVSVGTHVVVYGGQTSVDSMKMSLGLSGNTAMNVGDAQTLAISGAKSTPKYSSSDTSIVTVDSDGVVTAVGNGTATITVTCAASGSYLETSTTLTITVGTPEEEHVHDWVAQTVHHDAVTQTVTDSEAYDETTTVYFCDGCGTDFTSQADADAHLTANGGYCDGTITANNTTIHHDAVTHEETVTAAYDEITGYVCSECGETKGPDAE